MLSKEELLRDRYKVIADYFYSPYKIGDIITVQYPDRSVHLTTTRHRDEFGEMVDTARYHHPNEMKNYPHLFKPLQWWSYRKREDMPLYVKSKDSFYRVDRWTGSFQNVHWIGCYVHGDVKFIYSDNLSPATIEEYEQYNQQKKL